MQIPEFICSTLSGCRAGGSPDGWFPRVWLRCSNQSSMDFRVRQIRLALVCVTALVGGVFCAPFEAGAAPVRPVSGRGELGGDMIRLNSYYTAPAPGESNHYFEMWKPGIGIRDIARLHGLTNNRALFIHSHGEAVSLSGRRHYGFRPHQGQMPAGVPAPAYSVQDLFSLVGSARAASIHNIYVSGCNTEGRFSTSELRSHFPSATNITHIAAGNEGFEPMFIQAVTLPSADVTPLFETERTKGTGETAYSLGTTAAPGARKLPPYVAEIFLPGSKRPFKIRIAGREFLDPSTAAVLR